MRINLVPPYELTDQHLVAEYCEILMLCGTLQRTLRSKKGFQINKVPKEFTLGKGHAYFFYDKGLYLHNRFVLLKGEMLRRGIKANKIFPITMWPKELLNNWTPTFKDLTIIRKRISDRIKGKPGWYKKDKLLIDNFINQYE